MIFCLRSYFQKYGSFFSSCARFLYHFFKIAYRQMMRARACRKYSAVFQQTYRLLINFHIMFISGMKIFLAFYKSRRIYIHYFKFFSRSFRRAKIFRCVCDYSVKIFEAISRAGLEESTKITSFAPPFKAFNPKDPVWVKQSKTFFPLQYFWSIFLLSL